MTQIIPECGTKRKNGTLCTYKGRYNGKCGTHKDKIAPPEIIKEISKPKMVIIDKEELEVVIDEIKAVVQHKRKTFEEVHKEQKEVFNEITKDIPKITGFNEDEVIFGEDPTISKEEPKLSLWFRLLIKLGIREKPDYSPYVDNNTKDIGLTKEMIDEVIEKTSFPKSESIFLTGSDKFKVKPLIDNQTLKMNCDCFSSSTKHYKKCNFKYKNS